MRITELNIEHVRILSHAELSPGEGINLIIGRNGSGKTSILESIHLLSLAKSFRTPRISQVIQNKAPQLRVTAKIQQGSEESQYIGIEKSRTSTLMKYQGAVIRTASEQAKNLPLLLVYPESHQILTGSPRERRRWLDWSLFHVKPNYLEQWKQYHHALRQRNRLIRDQAADQHFHVWESSMAKHGEALVSIGAEYIKRLNSVFEREVQKLSGEHGVIHYQPGWNQDIILDQVLLEKRCQDRLRGMTTSGPHRADIRFDYQEQNAASVLSRGQSKLYLLALLFSQQELLKNLGQDEPLILIDDIAAELDSAAQEIIANRLINISSQSFITTTEPAVFNDFKNQLFHVERGEIK